MSEFKHTLARIAVWNLAGFNKTNPAEGIKPNSQCAHNQAEGLALHDT